MSQSIPLLGLAHDTPDTPPPGSPVRRVFEGFGGLPLVADAYGNPDHPPVLFAHGGGQTRHAWGAAAATIAGSGRYAVTLDLRGHGESGWPPDGNYSPESMVGDLYMVATALPSPPVAVGASMGGLLSLGLAGEIGGDVLAGLVLVDITPKMDNSGVEKILAFMHAHADGFASLDEAADAIAAYLPHRDRPTDLSGLNKNLRLREDGRYVWHWDPALLKPGHSDDRTNLERLNEAARKLTIPTLLVRGQRSEIVSEEGVRHFLDLVPHAEYADVRDAHHMVAGDTNDAFADAVIGFLDRRFPIDP